MGRAIVNNNQPVDADFDAANFIVEVAEKTKSMCHKNNYINTCNRIWNSENEVNQAGLANVVNRAIEMMSKDGITLSAALAQLEAEYEGMG